MKLELETFLRFGRKIIPKSIFTAAQPIYHYILAFFVAIVNFFPSRKIFVLGVTGTKGKTTTIEIVNKILEDAGYKTAIVSTLRFKIGGKSERNMFKMTMPGRFFLQSFIYRAAKEGCQYILLEMTSEGTKQFRHKFIDLDALIFTNLSPEHIESHGSFEKYREAKLKIAKALEKSKKEKKYIIANRDDENGKYFLDINVSEKIEFSANDRELSSIKTPNFLPGKFNLYNIAAAVAFAKSQNIDLKIIKKAIESFEGVAGRMENIDEGQDFKVIVDYAHTPDSLQKVYETLRNEDSRLICILGSTGGGRDKWKRPEMGKIAGENCQKIILTDEDSYDENPTHILSEIKSGISNSKFLISNVDVILDRREAIKKAVGYAIADRGDAVVIITGKGTDPYIMGPNGKKTPWSDADVAREELKLIKSSEN